MTGTREGGFGIPAAYFNAPAGVGNQVYFQESYNMRPYISRRDLLKQAALAGAATLIGSSAKASRSPNDKLNIACIGVGGQGASDLGNVSSENIVAMCDVDAARAADSFNRFPNSKKYTDFRRMLDQQKDIEAVVVSIPDHCHAPAAVMAMKMGKHVYCQKPLANSVAECRSMTQVAAAHPKIVTQMGTQNHSHPSYCRVVELIQAGAIGPVREAHVITDRPIWPQGMPKPTDTPSVPATLSWDLWLGPARARPYHPSYLPFVWRGWWDFGTGALGDMACHLMDPTFWALNLGAPSAVEATCDALLPDSGPKWSVITYEFPIRGDQPAMKLVWYDGGKTPGPDVLGSITLKKDFNGTIYIGDKGKIYIEHGQMPELLPSAKFADYKGPAETLTRTPGHHKEWINAIKNGGVTGSRFSFAGPMTEALLLGNVALRVGKRIEWDAESMVAKDCPEADKYIRYEYRRGYRL